MIEAIRAISQDVAAHKVLSNLGVDGDHTLDFACVWLGNCLTQLTQIKQRPARRLASGERVRFLGYPPCDQVGSASGEGTNHKSLDGSAIGWSAGIVGFDEAENKERTKSDGNRKQ